MEVCGIVCEYNPFHRGHAYLLAQVRRRLGEDTAIVCAMSGDFVQRGEAAAFAKHDRAAAAVACGADLVLELPLPWSIAGAENFARGGVGLLAATSVVTHLAFGSESGALDELERTAALLLRPELDAGLRAGLEQGLSYAAARQCAAEALAGAPLPALRTPNDILAVEYLKCLPADIAPLAVKRLGAAHDSPAGEAVSSASFLRQKLAAGEDLAQWMPAEAWAVLRDAPCPDPALLETALLSRLRCLPETAFADQVDAGVGEGFYHRVYEAARVQPSLAAIEDAAAAKRYPRARVRRLCLGAALGLTAGDAAGTPPYLRVLAANDRGRSLLRRMETSCALPVVTKPARARELAPEARHIFEMGALAADLYALGCADEALRTGGRDWRSSPVIVK